MGRAVAGQLGVCCLLVTVSGCVSHQSRNSIRRAWVDFNSLGQPAVTFEQTDHLPYHAERVGHFLWMYGSTPGHQNVYKDRRYQQDLLTGEMVTSEEAVTEGSPSDATPSGTAAETVESPGPNRNPPPVPRVPPNPKPPAPPVDVPAPPAKKSGRPADTPLRPPVPAPPKPVGPTARKSQDPTARKPSPSRWTTYRKKGKQTALKPVD